MAELVTVSEPILQDTADALREKTGTTRSYSPAQFAEAIRGIEGTVGPKGEKGDKGDTGTTFTPSVDSAGNITWANDGGLPNPDPANIKGPKGDMGPGMIAQEMTQAEYDALSQAEKMDGNVRFITDSTSVEDGDEISF